MVKFVSDTNVECPIKWGDRVDHVQHGFGAVNGHPKPCFSGGVEDGVAWNGVVGWNVPVAWDDATVSVSTALLHRFSSRVNQLILVNRPDAKGARYWEAHWLTLVESVRAARRLTDLHLERPFRAGGVESLGELDHLLQQEKLAIEAVLEFKRQDDAGEHQ